MGAHDEDGCDLDFAGVAEWIADYHGEDLSCAVRASGDDRVDSSALYYSGLVKKSPDAAPPEQITSFLIGNGRIDLLATDFVLGRASYQSDIDIHSLYAQFRGFALLVSAGAPPTGRAE
jgi:hypothetical protein